jgi:hypothetical protein
VAVDLDRAQCPRPIRTQNLAPLAAITGAIFARSPIEVFPILTERAAVARLERQLTIRVGGPVDQIIEDFIDRGNGVAATPGCFYITLSPVVLSVL